MQTIAWDVDDVLNELTRAWFERWGREGGTCPGGGYAALTANPPHEVCGISRQEYLASLDAFRASGEGVRLPPRPEALEWFVANGARYRHVAVTATPLANAPASAAWVMRHFGRWIRTYHLVPSPRPGEELPPYDTDKASAFARLGRIDLVVDDSPEVIEGARAAGIAAVVFPQPWNAAIASTAETFDALVPALEAAAAAHREDGQAT